MSAIGYFAVSGTTFTPSSVSLAPGATQQVNVTTDPVPYALPQAYELTVLATSQTDGSVQDIARETVIFTAEPGVDVEWLVPSKTIPFPAPVTFVLVVTNTGNIATEYDLSATFGALVAALPQPSVTIPAGFAGALSFVVTPPSDGTFPFDATADDGTVSDTDSATLVVEEPTAVDGLRSQPNVADMPQLYIATMLLLISSVLLVLWRKRRYFGRK
ncbi:MAG: hypothetical protein M9928_10785 [Anaerolineae bacterium]|nr:hypothetical protein [Anaerolineae bacterium]